MQLTGRIRFRSVEPNIGSVEIESLSVYLGQGTTATGWRGAEGPLTVRSQYTWPLAGARWMGAEGPHPPSILKNSKAAFGRLAARPCGGLCVSLLTVGGAFAPPPPGAVVLFGFPQG